MKLCGVPILVLLLSLGAASGQQTQPRDLQSTALLQAPSSRSSYDPMARGNVKGDSPYPRTLSFSYSTPMLDRAPSLLK
jgi:hypothetical protein